MFLRVFVAPLPEEFWMLRFLGEREWPWLLERLSNLSLLGVCDIDAFLWLRAASPSTLLVPSLLPMLIEDD